MTTAGLAGSRRRPKVWWAVAAALFLVGASALTLGLRGGQQALAGPAISPAGTRVTHTVSTPSKISPLHAARSIPVSLSVPAINLTVSLSTLGLNFDGTVQVPTDIQQPGWYRLGPTPGQVGSAVILGHVDSYQGPAVFYNLRALVAGDQVNVTLADGVVAEFQVSSVSQYLKTQFPGQQIYASQGFSALQLVTCGGAFDSSTGHYLSNIVVYTSLVKVIPAPVAPAILPTPSGRSLALHDPFGAGSAAASSL